MRGLERVSGRSPCARHQFALLAAFFVVVFCPEERHFAAVNFKCAHSLCMVGVYTLFLVANYSQTLRIGVEFVDRDGEC